jgi:hypothetical protein
MPKPNRGLKVFVRAATGRSSPSISVEKISLLLIERRHLCYFI